MRTLVSWEAGAGRKAWERLGCGVLGASEDNGTTSADVDGMERLSVG